VLFDSRSAAGHHVERKNHTFSAIRNGVKMQAFEQLREIIHRYWGYDDFRPLQAEAMRAVVEGRDSLVVLPTGGGKSLCFQAPAMAMPGLAVVVSPLIALMKDQVDALVDCGIPAACVNSTLEFDQRRRIAEEIRAERIKILPAALLGRGLSHLAQVAERAATGRA
jgi:superfamily II DNA helicase RecQ